MSTEIGLEYLYDLRDMLTDWQEEHVEAEVEVAEDGTWASVFAPGIYIRGFSVRNDDAPYLRLSSLASRGDWRLAFSFLRFAADRNATPELTADEMSEERSQDRGAEEFRKGVRILQHMLYERGNEFMGLPVRHFALNVDRGDLPQGDVDFDALEQRLIDRAARYARARVPTVLTIDSSITAVVWSGEALLTVPADYVILGNEELFIDWKSFIAAYKVETIRGKEPLLFYFP